PAGTWVAAVSPDGAKVAGMVFDQRAEPDAPPSFVYLIDLRRGPDALPLVAGLPNGVRGLIEWIDDDRFALFPGGDSVLRTYDASLNLLGEIGNWPPGAGVLARGVVYGMRHATSTSTMLAATLPNGPVEVLGTFDSPQLAAVAFVPGAVR